jgi:nucleoside-diphosphate-sugar epimerase
MNVVIVGGHGKIAMRLLKLLADRGDTGRGVIRNPDHAKDLEEIGATPIVLDIENREIGDAVAGADAVVFAAGAGPGSGPERKQTVDLGGAVKLIEAAKAGDIKRYVIVSSMGADDPPPGDEGFPVYLQAKAAADQALATSRLDFTIVRPGGLTDDPGSGRIDAAEHLGRRGQIPRDDVAATLVAALDEPATIGKTFEILSGEQEIAAALRNL